MLPPLRRLLLALLVLVMIAAACGDSDDDGDGGSDTTTADATSDTEAEATEAETTDTEAETSDTEADAADDASGGTADVDLVLSIGADETSLNAYTYTTGYPGWNLMTLINDTLLVLDERNEPQPLLATGFEVSDDGTLYTMTLRDDVTWHDGEPFDADDVAFTFDYVVANAHPRWTPGVADVTGVEVIDPATVAITLDGANPDFPVRPLADMPILAEHVWADVADPQNSGVEQNIGTGPYVLASYEAGQRYELEANPNWAPGTPAVSRLIIPIIPEPATAFAALQSGELGMVTEEVEPQLVEQFESNGDLTVVAGPGFTTSLLNISNTEAPLDRVELRQAISLAIDPQELVDIVLLGAGTLPNPAFLHPDGPLAGSTLEHTHDPEAAAALLDGIGAELGDDGTRVLDGEPLSFELLSYASDPLRLRTADLIAEQLGEVGISVTVSALEASVVDEFVWPEFNVANGQDYELAMWRWTAPVQLDVARYGSLFFSDPGVGTFNVVGFADPDVDAAIDAVGAAVSTDERQALLDDLQATIAEQVPLVPLYYADGVYAYRPDVYDGWTFQDGQGLLHKGSLVDWG
ncbi:MAG: ABC transporter substrate-binding protein [Actinomycetota bacterium]